MGKQNVPPITEKGKRQGGLADKIKPFSILGLILEKCEKWDF